MKGLIVVHIFLLSFFVIKATSTIARRATPKGASATTSDMRISTYNLRYDSQPDNITVQQTLANLPDPLVAPQYLANTGEHPWSTRRIKVAEHLLHSGVVMAGTSYAQRPTIYRVIDPPLLYCRFHCRFPGGACAAGGRSRRTAGQRLGLGV